MGWVLIFLLEAPTASLEAKCFYHFPQDCNPTPITDQDICDFHEVDSDLYRGSHPKCSGYVKLAALGIRTIINLEGGASGELQDCERKAHHAEFGFRFISFHINPLETALTGVSDHKMSRLFTLMGQAPKPIFISCRLGKDRTGVVVALYRMKRREMSFSQARQEAYYYRYTSRLIGLKRTLDRYRDSGALAALPTPVISSKGPQAVCRPKGLEGFAEERRD
jgi:protein tyrosine/serine phosphatase